MMHTLCPECKLIHPVTAEQLRKTRGMLKCSACSAHFDALEYISDQEPDKSALPASSEPFPVQTETHKPRTFLWASGLFAGIVLLFIQFFYFESYNLSQNLTLRLWLLNVCSQLNCKLPDYKNVQEISILMGALESRDEQSFTFKTVIINQARFPQPYPAIKLTLLNYNGDTFAERVFSAHNYRLENSLLAVGETAEINLIIAVPQNKIGGYTFKLL